MPCQSHRQGSHKLGDPGHTGTPYPTSPSAKTLQCSAFKLCSQTSLLQHLAASKLREPLQSQLFSQQYKQPRHSALLSPLSVLTHQHFKTCDSMKGKQAEHGCRTDAPADVTDVTCRAINTAGILADLFTPWRTTQGTQPQHTHAPRHWGPCTTEPHSPTLLATSPCAQAALKQTPAPEACRTGTHKPRPAKHSWYTADPGGVAVAPSYCSEQAQPPKWRYSVGGVTLPDPPPVFCLSCSAAVSPPGLKLDTLQGVRIRVPEENGRPAGHAACVGDAGTIQQSRQPVHVSNTDAEVAVTTPVLCNSSRDGCNMGRYRDRSGTRFRKQQFCRRDAEQATRCVDVMRRQSGTTCHTTSVWVCEWIQVFPSATVQP